MIVYDKPVLRRQYTEEASKQGHLHEGKFAPSMLPGKSPWKTTTQCPMA